MSDERPNGGAQSDVGASRIRAADLPRRDEDQAAAGGPSSGSGGGASSPPPGGQASAPRQSSPARRGELKQVHNGVLFMCGMFATAFEAGGDAHCAEVIGTGAPILADKWTTVAEHNPAIRAFLVRAATGGVWGEALVATAAIALPVMQHHGMYPAWLPNPWMMMHPPASAEVAQEDAVRMADAVAEAFAVPPGGAVNMADLQGAEAQARAQAQVKAEAEAQRQAAEAHRNDHHAGASDL